MDVSQSIDVLEKCYVAPPPNSIPTTTIPFTFFDVLWILCPPVERILFYEFRHSTSFFTQTILPHLKHSLSLTLQHYFPLAGSIVIAEPFVESHLLYRNGDSIPLTIAESKGDFERLLKKWPIDAREFRQLVPQVLTDEIGLVSKGKSLEVTKQRIQPLIALQVTIFPNSGISICLSYRHGAGDGRTMINFIKSLAHMFKSKNNVSRLVQPCLDRAALINNDPNRRLYSLFCDVFSGSGLTTDDYAIFAATKVEIKDRLHATFELQQRDIDKLKHWIKSQFENIPSKPPPLSHVSTFVAACAFIWTCLTRTESVVAPSDNDDSYHFGFLVDCTNLTGEFKVPKTYLGNCLAFCGASVKRSELLGENGLFVAAKAIMAEVKKLESGVSARAETWLSESGTRLYSGHLIDVAGSHRLGVYETDFGWGRPKRSEMVHIDNSTNTFSITESGDDDGGGVEIGLAFDKVGMDAFISIFQSSLNNIYL